MIFFFKYETKANAKKIIKCWNIKANQIALGPEVCHILPFVHAILGCDTTSRLFGLGKGVSLNHAISDVHFRQTCDIFQRTNSKKTDIVAAGEKALVCLYNGHNGESLDLLQHRRFCEKVATNKACVQPSGLPPTSASALFHSMRVYYQVNEWKIDDAAELQACDWGWKIAGGRCIPVMSDKDPAPKILLDMIRCSCKFGCSSNRCSCRKNNLECSAACISCKGIGCTNAGVVDEDFTD